MKPEGGASLDRAAPLQVPSSSRSNPLLGPPSLAETTTYSRFVMTLRLRMPQCRLLPHGARRSGGCSRSICCGACRSTACTVLPSEAGHDCEAHCGVTGARPATSGWYRWEGSRTVPRQAAGDSSTDRSRGSGTDVTALPATKSTADWRPRSSWCAARPDGCACRGRRS